MTEPRQKPNRSKQDYETPHEFIIAVEKRFGPLDCDLAADEHNAQAPVWFSLGEHADIARWAQKCAESIGPWTSSVVPVRRILLLTPASIGSNWFARFVHRKAFVLGLNPRLKFVGELQSYPKDLMLSVFATDIDPGFDVWRWRR